MPPPIALLVWSILLVVLIRYGSSTESKPAPALWIPIIWIFLMGSRLPSQWLGTTPTTLGAAFIEGSGLDRGIYLALMAAAIGVLATRPINWFDLMSRNTALIIFLLFALASVIWSDYPFVTFKRWVRDLGTYYIILLVLSDACPPDAVRTVVRRVSYLLVCFSIVLIKYYPASGVLYDPWSGLPEYAGVTTSKNMLGAVCLTSGLFFFWDTLRLWSERERPATRRTLLVNALLIAMTVWLTNLSNSATSKVCLAIGCLLIALFHGRLARTYPRAVATVFPVILAAYLMLDFVFDVSSVIATFLGRDPTFHGRTGIWSALIAVQTNPLVGVGYQTFWLGDRLTTVWRSLNARFLNEAHNGYLEIYLNLGIVGVLLLVTILISSYRALSKQLAASVPLASFGLALLSILIVYNQAEAAFGASFLWSMFLLCGIAVPKSAVALAQLRELTVETNRQIRSERGSSVSTRNRVTWRTGPDPALPASRGSRGTVELRPGRRFRKHPNDPSTR